MDGFSFGYNVSYGGNSFSGNFGDAGFSGYNSNYTGGSNGYNFN